MTLTAIPLRLVLAGGLGGQSFMSQPAVLACGMQIGKPSVAIGIFLDDGGVVLGQTSLALFLSAADAMKARYGDPRT